MGSGGGISATGTGAGAGGSAACIAHPESSTRPNQAQSVKRDETTANLPAMPISGKYQEEMQN
jgi:hypothetical protein